MAYTQTNLLHRIEQAQTIWAEHNKDERSNVWIYEHHIYPKFHISIKTFYNWLNVNVAKKRRELSEKHTQEKQLNLFN